MHPRYIKKKPWFDVSKWPSLRENDQQLQRQIRNLEKELAEVQEGQGALRLQPCRGDSEIREKDGKLEEPGRPADTISETIRDLEKRREIDGQIFTIMAIIMVAFFIFVALPILRWQTDLMVTGMAAAEDAFLKVRHEAA